jgi:Dolichyl-phosphate-mannose-protein mannosyltransferase
MATQTATAEMKSQGQLHSMSCVAVLFVATCVTYPFAEMGISDDWSYIRTAQVMAETGHFVYNGWAAPILGWQVLIGALFIKLFGFSFTATRLSTFLVALLTTYLLHRILVRLGINNWNATVGTLVVVLSPIFLQLAPTFMSDVPGFFAAVVCLYCCIRALQTPSPRGSLQWLFMAAGSNIVLGTARQIAWLGVLVMVPCTAWMLRRRKGLLSAGVICWVIGVFAIFGCLHWFNQQPHVVPEKLISVPVNGRALAEVPLNLIRTALSLALFALPVLIAFPYSDSALKHSGSNLRLLIAAMATAALGIVAAVSVIAVRAKLGHMPAHVAMPWMGDIVTIRGPWSGALVGTHPLVMGIWFRVIVSLITVLAAASCIAYLTMTRGGGSKYRQSLTIPRGQLHLLLIPFGLAYLGLILQFAVSHLVYDRYLITPLFLVVIYLLLFYQDRLDSRLPLPSIALLFLFAAYAMAATHDYFSLGRARLAAATELRDAGVPRDNIGGGFEYDGWTQILATGYMTDPGIAAPPGTAHAALQRKQSSCFHVFDKFADWTPAVSPKFVLSYDQLCFVPSQYAPIAHRTWLPPYDQKVYIRFVP